MAHRDVLDALLHDYTTRAEAIRRDLGRSHSAARSIRFCTIFGSLASTTATADGELILPSWKCCISASARWSAESTPKSLRRAAAIFIPQKSFLRWWQKL